ncbi:hypothetical protein [uncultured Bacteroides sp.]|uniref:hypothetical protein n=1 Tax=uncultured Bacteroides sp. TaxID=162156 RepID=UPI0023CC6A6E|nr:hypothetical protein [uncultured Bacteroides sp.]MDE6172599.1 hypothetical protein [Bacteroides sp.]
MKTLNAGKILLLLMVVIGLSSCGDEYYTDDYLRNSDEKLCNRVWVEEYETNDNELCEHYLEFSRNGSGKETFKYKPIDGRKPYESSYRFDWAWIDNSMEGLILDYGGNDRVFFDNVWVREHNLSGKLDGVIVAFVDANYYK